MGGMEESTFTALKDIFLALMDSTGRTGVLSPQRFLEIFKRDNEMFRNSMHQDAHEFYGLVLNDVITNVEENARKQQALTNGDGLTESLQNVLGSALAANGTQSPGTGWVHNIFEGLLTSETQCLNCGTGSQRDETFLDLSIDLEEHSSVTSCLRKFSDDEQLCERNKFHCDTCGGLEEAEKRMKVKRLPKVLTLHLKRFKYTEDYSRLQKLFHRVVYPYHLRLFNTTEDAEDPDRIYELYAVVVHIGGGPYHGHYVAVIKTQDRGWLLFDDEMVEPVDKNYVRNFFGDKPGLACAYVLFYQETTMDAIRKEQKMEGKRRASQDLANGLAVDTRQSAELHRVQTVSPGTEGMQYATLDHAMTAPEFMTNGHIEPPKSPPLTSDRPVSPVVQSKKEKAKEDKARKAAEKVAEKERQEAEKQRRKELATKLSEAHKRQEAELKAALEASKASKAEEDKRHGLERSVTSPNGSSHSGLDRFKRSKSLRFGSLTKRDKPQPKPSDENLATSSASAETDSQDVEKDKDKDTPPREKKNRFSIRKKSFGMLS